MDKNQSYQTNDEFVEKEYTKRKRNEKITIAVIAVLAVLALSLTAYSAMLYNSNKNFKTQLENSYERAYYQVIMDLNSLETALSKLQVTTNKGLIEKQLATASSIAQSGEVNLNQIPTSNEEVYTVTKFLNQVYDYTKSLSYSVAKTGKISDEQEEQIQKLYKTNVELKESFNKMYDGSADKGKLLIKKTKKSSTVMPMDDGMKKVSSSSIEYPELIYDGPFSDAKKGSEKIMRGKEITENEGAEALQKLFSVTDINNIGEVKSENLEAYNYSFEKQGNTSYAQMSKSGGKLVMLDSYREVKDKNMSEELLIAKATKFLSLCGYKNLQPVWKNYTGNVLLLNMAPKENGVVLYPDLVKIKVAMDNGDILGLEGFSYLKNNKPRAKLVAEKTIAMAQKKVSPKVKVETKRLTLIPLGSKEILAYEFMGKSKGQTFYVYIDAKTLEEVNILRVIQNTEGDLVL